MDGLGRRGMAVRCRKEKVLSSQGICWECDAGMSGRGTRSGSPGQGGLARLEEKTGWSGRRGRLRAAASLGGGKQQRCAARCGRVRLDLTRRRLEIALGIVLAPQPAGGAGDRLCPSHQRRPEPPRRSGPPGLPQEAARGRWRARCVSIRLPERSWSVGRAATTGR